MPELRLNVPQAVIDSINTQLNEINGNPVGTQLSANDIGREALAVYKWAVNQTNQGYAVVSADANRSPVVQIATESLPARAPTAGR